MPATLDPGEEALDDLIASVYADPLGYVMAMFPWDTEPSIQIVELPPAYQELFHCRWGPDQWAIDILEQLGRDIRANAFDGKTAVPPLAYAVASGHGIGKSVLVAWLVKFIMDTRPGSKGTVTATTADQLRTKTWEEVGKWHRMSLTAHRFDYRNGRGSMSLTSKASVAVGGQEAQRWSCNAQTCREENSEAFAGQHAASATSFYIFDEASGVPAKIFEVRRGGLTDGEPMTFDFGNPTKNSGAFFDMFHGRNALPEDHRWSIDSRTVQITNKELHAEWAKLWGEHSDFFKVRVRGVFPEQSDMQFISTGDVEAAMRRDRPYTKGAALIMGVDIGGGGDFGDETVIKVRHGMDMRSWPAKRFRGLDTVQVVGKIIETIMEFRALGMKVAAIFIDGGGLGQGVGDQLRHLGYAPIMVHFGGTPTDARTYKTRGDEMYGRMKDAIHTSLVLPEPDNDEGKDVRDQLTSREFGSTEKNQIHLERKKDMRKRGLPSPDMTDAYALTFAQDVAPQEMAAYANEPVFAITEYDPWSHNLDDRRDTSAAKPFFG